MTEVPLGSADLPAQPMRESAPKARGKRRGQAVSTTIFLWVLRLATLAGVGWIVSLELETSYLQSLLFTRVTQGMAFRVEHGVSETTHAPNGGPYDDRLGYTRLAAFVESLNTKHYTVESAARPSPALAEFIALGGYALYHEKSFGGLTIFDRMHSPLYASRVPERTYDSFEAIPPLVVDTLLFIENRHLLDPDHPTLDPAVEWDRLSLAVAGQIAHAIDPHIKEGGASTLATQLEKFRHSAGGRTDSAHDKLRQMVSAAARAYLDGSDTTAARRQIVVAYLNSTPLGSRPNFGEVIGLGDGLHAWYGTDFASANRVLAAPALDASALRVKALVYRQVLSLLLAQRRPSYYLPGNREGLEVLNAKYLDLLAMAGVIDPALYRAAVKVSPRIQESPGVRGVTEFVERKATDATRTELLSLLHIPSLYDLDRVDLSVETTLDTAAQRQVTDVLSHLGDRNFVRSLGLVGFHMLGNEDPARINYSVVLYERGADRNFVRLQADSLNEPFDINSGAKLILGSTAKLRTLISYLEIVAALHRQYAGLSPREIENAEANARDPLTHWALGYLAASPDRRLQAMLDSAMGRTYSANPSEEFFTGGGIHVFRNFERSDDGKVLSVNDAFQHSVNLVFIRLMRDMVRYYIVRAEGQTQVLLSDRDDPERRLYLSRFADQEGRTYLNRFYDDYHGLTPQEAVSRLVSRTRPVPRRLAVVFRSVEPHADFRAFQDFLHNRLSGEPLDDAVLAKLYADYAPDRFSLPDRGFLAGVHPLELWLVNYLQDHPKAGRTEMLGASNVERQEVYRWLFKTSNTQKQNARIRILLEEDAFNSILDDWRRLGYPFGQLVPSYATAIGSSGDRPDALAELIGIIVGNGVRVPTVRLERLHFAADTPYETNLAFQPPAPEQVLDPEIAATVRRALLGVVEHGTAVRARDSFAVLNTDPPPIGGKTGTGDNRFERFAADHRLIESRPVDRTATFVFFIGDRFFGTVTAYVPGAKSADYHFTSALAVQLFHDLAPSFQTLMTEPEPVMPTRQSSSDGAEPLAPPQPNFD
ncbi:MAG TPA: transglycosylase domain-containing protein [Alphaproteobacteria bacterium]|nr:transglycosylase domain-containing protein [Alphaproteobacteria bacterium]